MYAAGGGMNANQQPSAGSADISLPAGHIHFRRKEALPIPKPNPVRIVVHYPKPAEGRRTLAQRMAGVHADWVCEKLKKMNCPADQKVQLLNAVVDTAKRKTLDQAR